ncbi:MAG: hypothetical protein LQ340_005772 [Diploschistes diacapsis]|nr:MAG: hypothetical protein LQ340_005772 [Diploschistes diacapsis]
MADPADLSQHPSAQSYQKPPQSPKRTLLLYQQDPTLRTHTTHIQSIQPFTTLASDHQTLFKTGTPSHHVVITASTIFCAQGGGQPSDTGLMHGTSSSPRCSFSVESTRYGSHGQIFHFGHFLPPPSSSSSTATTANNSAPMFTVGEEVSQTIDSPKRDLHARIHTAGHILGLAVRHLRQMGTIPDDVRERKAMHYPDSAFVEFNGLIDGRHKEAIQAKADELVAAQIPVLVHFWSEAEMEERCAMPFDPALKAQAGEGDGDGRGSLLRAVEVQGVGAYPCGGTPTVDTGSCGLVVRRVSRQKGVSRVSYQVVEV